MIILVRLSSVKPPRPNHKTGRQHTHTTLAKLDAFDAVFIEGADSTILKASSIRISIKSLTIIFNEIHVDKVRARGIIALFRVVNPSHILFCESSAKCEPSFLYWV